MALTNETYDNRPEAVAFAFGRVWYAGAQTTRWSTKIFFSQVLLDNNRAGKCYQDADPTAEEINALIDTDGGVLSLPEAGRVVKMIPLTSVIIVLAENGVWAIQAGREGFSPLAFTRNQITEVGCISKKSVIKIEDSVMYAADNGIYQIGANEQGKIVATNITEPKVDSLYNSITFTQKANSVAIYDYKKKEYSLYYGTGNNTVGSINLRLKNGAWYPYRFDVNSSELPATFYMAIPFYSPRSRESSGTKVLVYSSSAEGSFYTINEYSDKNFNDFGVAPIDAYLKTSAITLDNPQFDKQATYATFYFDITETGVNGVDDTMNLVYTSPSSCLMTPYWSWSNSTKLGKQGRERQIYRLPDTPLDSNGDFDIGTDVLVVRDRVKGQGKALQFQFQTEPNKNMRLIGYTVNVSMDGSY